MKRSVLLLCSEARWCNTPWRGAPRQALSTLGVWSCVPRKRQGDEVPKVPKGYSEGFWHFWHPVGWRIRKNNLCL
jgi:hypothetical protein